MNDDFLRGIGVGAILAGIGMTVIILNTFKIKIKDLFKK